MDYDQYLAHSEVNDKLTADTGGNVPHNQNRAIGLVDESREDHDAYETHDNEKNIEGKGTLNNGKINNGEMHDEETLREQLRNQHGSEGGWKESLKNLHDVEAKWCKITELIHQCIYQLYLDMPADPDASRAEILRLCDACDPPVPYRSDSSDMSLLVKLDMSKRGLEPDPKSASRTSRALLYAVRMKKAPSDLPAFLEKHGGIKGCARKYAELNGTLKKAKAQTADQTTKQREGAKKPTLPLMLSDDGSLKELKAHLDPRTKQGCVTMLYEETADGLLVFTPVEFKEY